MQCAACNEEYPEALDECPQCRTVEPAHINTPPDVTVVEVPGASHVARQADAPAMTDNSNVTTRNTQSANNSTLIEFPGVNRNRPAWRKELSERFREIQQRRARDADLEGVETERQPSGQTFSAPEDARTTAPAKTLESATAKQLGLVPTPDEPELNPLVAAALRRIERARASAHAQPVARQGSGRAHAATAAARVVEEEPEQMLDPESTTQPAHPERNAGTTAAQAKRTSRRAERAEAEADAARHTPLVVVQPKQQAEQKQDVRAEPAALKTDAVETKATTHASTVTVATAEAASVVETTKKSEVSHAVEQMAQSAMTAEAQADAAKQPRHITGVLDEFWLERQGIELLPKVEAPELTYDDRAPRAKRIAAALVDLVLVAFLSAPFAAAIELTISNWGDPRVSGSMALIVALVMFLYHTCSVALAGRTLGMSLCGLHAVDARKANVPTTGQCMRRAVVYMLSLATFGLGLLYSLFDAEGRTAHDILSGTVVVKK
ncbi:MAG: hypothetical protein QOE46_2950 [Acidobacteriota bacterium]|nr:hypothetical protein [Acidobacteriota bacterium]